MYTSKLYQQQIEDELVGLKIDETEQIKQKISNHKHLI